jgi:hypothetical protein
VSLLHTNHAAFALGRFNVAYISLGAAMQEAKGEADAGRLEEVARLAEEQLAWIDANAADYAHSTASCRARNATSIYEALAQRARAFARYLDSGTINLKQCRDETDRTAAPRAPKNGFQNHAPTRSSESVGGYPRDAFHLRGGAKFRSNFAKEADS